MNVGRRVPRFLVACALVVAVGAVAVSPAASQPDPNKPFGQPQYLIHITGHGTVSGGVKDDALVLHPSKPDAEGNFLVADGSGGTFGYSSDFHSGPYNTPAEVCAAAAGRLKPGEVIASFSSSADSVDCAAFLPSAGTTTTSVAAGSTTTIGGTTTTTEPAPACNVRGQVTDYFGAPVPGIHISLRAGGLELETSTLDDGTYEFAEIGDDPAGGVFDSRTDPVTVALVTEEWAHNPQRFIVYYRQRGAVLSADPFLIPSSGDCTRDFDLGAIPPNYIPNGPPLNEWPDMVQLYQGIHRAWALADLLGINLAYGLPLQVRGFCDVGCTESEASFFGTKSSGSQIVDRPLISFGPSESRLLSLNWPDNREYHEFGHYVAAASFNGIPDRGADRNHGGYANSSSTDSWSEGFAEFWASMVAKYIERRQRPEIYQWNQGRLPSNSPNAPPAPGTNLLDPWPAWVDEEFAVASLLVRLENLDVASAPPPPRSPRTLRVLGFAEVTDPVLGRLIVGRISNDTVDGASIGTVAGVAFYNGQRQVVDAVYGSTIPANLGANGGTGVFVLPVPKGVTYTELGVTAHEGRPPPPDPVAPPLDVSLAEIWAAIVGYPSTKPLAAGHTHDVEDLYQALKFAFGGRGVIIEGLDTIDRLFIEHGFFEDLDGDGNFVPGDRIGMTSHPEYGDQELCAANILFGCSARRIPRTGYLGYDVTRATVNISTSTTDKLGQVYAQVLYPAPNQHRSYGYLVVPDAQSTVQLAVPPPGTGATLVLIGIADGHTPAVLGTIGADTFWDDAERQQGRPFLTFSTTLTPGDFAIPSGAGAATPAAGASTTTAGEASATSVPSRSTGSGGGGGGGGAGVIVVVAGLAAAALIGFTMARRRRVP